MNRIVIFLLGGAYLFTQDLDANLINETDYFYPNGGELIQDYSSIPITWNCFDDSFENANVRVGFSYLLGGWESEVVNTSSIFNNESFYSKTYEKLIQETRTGLLRRVWNELRIRF